MAYLCFFNHAPEDDIVFVLNAWSGPTWMEEIITRNIKMVLIEYLTAFVHILTTKTQNN